MSAVAERSDGSGWSVSDGVDLYGHEWFGWCAWCDSSVVRGDVIGRSFAEQTAQRALGRLRSEARSEGEGENV